MESSASASASSLCPPVQLRPRGGSVTTTTTPQLSIQSHLAMTSSNLMNVNEQGFDREPQTPSSLVRKNTAPTTFVPAYAYAPRPGRTSSSSTSSSSSSSGGFSSDRTRRSAISSSAGGDPFGEWLDEGVDDVHPGSPNRPMLSVLLSLGVATLPPFARPAAYDARRRTTGSELSASRRRHSRRSAYRQRAVQDAAVAAQAPFTSLFITPPSPSPSSSSSSSPNNATKQKMASTSFYVPILGLLILFVSTLIPICLALYSLPLRSYGSSFPPKTLKDIAALTTAIHTYASSTPSSFYHVLLVLSFTAIWKHAWSIPGSVVLNVIAGTLFSSAWVATLHMTLLTTLGSIAASMLSAPLAPLVRTFFPRALSLTQGALEGSGSIGIGAGKRTGSPSKKRKNGGGGGIELDALDEKLLGADHNSNTAVANAKDDTTPTWVRLVVMRLIGIVPWSGINVACGVCGVSIRDCFIGSFIGTLPWTAVTCQIGDIIQTLSVASSNSNSVAGSSPQTLGSVLASPSIIAKLVLLSALSLGPVLYRDKLRAVLGSSSSSSSSSSLLSNPSQEHGGAQGMTSGNHSGASSPTSVDEDHLLPLVYSPTVDRGFQHHQQQHQQQPTSSSEASSTVGGDDHDVEMFEHDEEDDVISTKSKRMSTGIKWWSFGKPESTGNL